MIARNMMLSATLLMAIACDKEDTAAEEDEHTHAATAPCDEETRAVTLAAGTTFSGDQAEIMVSEADVLPPIVGMNTWTIGVSAGGVAQAGCSMNAEIDMPDHGHGGPTPTFTEQGDGSYLTEVQFTMGGYWEVEVALDCPDVQETVLLNVCIEG